MTNLTHLEFVWRFRGVRVNVWRRSFAWLWWGGGRRGSHVNHKGDHLGTSDGFFGKGTRPQGREMILHPPPTPPPHTSYLNLRPWFMFIPCRNSSRCVFLIMMSLWFCRPFFLWLQNAGLFGVALFSFEQNRLSNGYMFSAKTIIACAACPGGAERRFGGELVEVRPGEKRGFKRPHHQGTVRYFTAVHRSV